MNSQTWMQATKTHLNVAFKLCRNKFARFSELKNSSVENRHIEDKIPCYSLYHTVPFSSPWLSALGIACLFLSSYLTFLILRQSLTYPRVASSFHCKQETSNFWSFCLYLSSAKTNAVESSHSLRVLLTRKVNLDQILPSLVQARVSEDAVLHGFREKLETDTHGDIIFAKKRESPHQRRWQIICLLNVFLLTLNKYVLIHVGNQANLKWENLEINTLPQKCQIGPW